MFGSHSPDEIVSDKLLFAGPFGFPSSSPFSSGELSVVCSRFVLCRNSSNHCLGVNTAFPSKARASSFGTMFLSAIQTLVQFVFVKNGLLRHVAF